LEQSFFADRVDKRYIRRKLGKNGKIKGKSDVTSRKEYKMKVVRNEDAITRKLGEGTLHKVLSYDDNLMVCESGTTSHNNYLII